MTDTKKTKRARKAAGASGSEAGRTGPHMAPPAVGDRFPTGAGGHPIPGIGETGGDKPGVHLRTGRVTGEGRLTPEAAASGEGQGAATGDNPPDPEESQIERGSAVTDIADAAQNERPGRPPNATIDPRRAQEKPRRRDFARAVEGEKERKED